MRRFNPFEQLCEISSRSYSRRCQKLITDFGIEESFQSATVRMKEHHGVEINVSAARNITEKHAERAAQLLEQLPEAGITSQQIILEMDGEMVPLVEYEDAKDRRMNKKNLWRELRVGAIQRQGELEWKYASSFESPDELGDRMARLAKKMGFNEETRVHGVGDGALWIVEQGERIAGHNYKHLIDLPHLCEYLGKAVIVWCREEEVKKEVNVLKDIALREGIEKVIDLLERHLPNHPEHEGLNRCLKYIKNRPGQFMYKEAKEQGLPVGSGKIESTHRHLMQKRLKKPGTWWIKENAAHMADLRTLRRNGGWRLLWQESKCQEQEKLAA